MYQDEPEGLSSAQIPMGAKVSADTPLRAAINRIENATSHTNSLIMRLDQVAGRIAGYQQDPSPDANSVESVKIGEHESLTGVLHELEHSLGIAEQAVNRMEQL